MLRLIESAPEPRMPPPAGALPCVWMSAGLVAYKLCDRGFECEGCPFDQAMRGARPALPRPAGWDAAGWAGPGVGVARRAASGS